MHYKNISSVVNKWGLERVGCSVLFVMEKLFSIHPVLKKLQIENIKALNIRKCNLISVNKCCISHITGEKNIYPSRGVKKFCISPIIGMKIIRISRRLRSGNHRWKKRFQLCLLFHLHAWMITRKVSDSNFFLK